MASNALERAYRQSTKQIQTRVLDMILRLFMAGQYRDADAARFVAAVVPIVLAAERQIAQLTFGHLARALGFTATPTFPTDVYSGAALRNGTDPKVVYQRPFVTVRTALSEGKTFDEAVDEGTNRLEDITRTDLQLARTHASRAVLEETDSTIVGYRRVLVGAENCALCVIASTQRYHKGDLLPIHPGCDCDIAALTDADEDEQVLDDVLLDAAHNAVADRLGVSDRGGRAIDYRKVLLVREHGEYGPTLTVARDLFTGPDDIPQTTRE